MSAYQPSRMRRWSAGFTPRARMNVNPVQCTVIPMRARQEVEESDGTRTTTSGGSSLLRTGRKCCVDGVLDAYLGSAHLEGEKQLFHAFALYEWRPHTTVQLPVTLVRENDLAESVVPMRPPLIR